MDEQDVTVRYWDNSTTTERGTVRGEWALVEFGDGMVSYTYLPTGQGVPCITDASPEDLRAALEALAALPPCPESSEVVIAYGRREREQSEAHQTWLAGVLAVLAHMR